MITRVHFEDAAQARDAAARLAASDLEVALVEERSAGDDDGEAIVYVVATPAGLTDAAEVIGLDAADPRFEVG